MKRRLDELLVSRDMVADLKEARARILAGEIIVEERRVDKAGYQVTPQARIRIRPRKGRVFVSRAGEKLDHALSTASIDVRDLVCLDLGASTGGFTDCLLSRGAKKVFAVDVGYGLLDWRLRTDPRVVNLERTHANSLTEELIPEPVQFLCADLSFTSLHKIIPHVVWRLARDARIAMLIKPQFEAKSYEVQTGGLVVDPLVHQRVCSEIKTAIGVLGFLDLRIIQSPIKGTKGNQEFLLIGRWE